MTITVAALLSAVRGARAGDTFSLATAPLASPPLDALAAAHLPGATLRLSAVTALDEAADGQSVTVRGTGADLPFTGMRVEAVFSVVGGNAALRLTATAAAGWTFTGAFPALASTVAAGFRFLASPAPVLVLRSHQEGASAAGLSFAGTMDLASMTGGLAGLIGRNTQPLTGTVGMRKNGGEVVALALTGPVATRVNLGLATVEKLAFTVGGHLTWDPLERKASVAPYLGLSGAIPFRAQGRDHTLPIAVEIADLGREWRFTADLTGGIAAAWDELSALAGGVGLGSLIPSGVHLDDLLTFHRLSFDLDLRLPSKVAFVGLEVGNATPWTLMRLPGSDRDLLLDQLRLLVSVREPFATRTAWVSVEGQVVIGTAGTLVAGAHYPSFAVSAALKEDTVLHLPEVIADFAGADVQVPALDVYDLRVLVAGADFSVDVELEGEWRIGTSKVQITEVRCSVARSAGDTRIDAGGQVRIGSVDVSVSGVHPGAGRGWRFEGSTGAGQAIPIGTLVADLVRLFGVDTAIPASVSSAVIQNLHVSFDTGTRAFSFSGETKLQLDASHELDLVVTIDVQPSGTGYRKTFRGTLTLGALQFALAFDQDTAATRFVASYHDLAGGTVNLGTLVAEVTSEQELVELAQSLTITLKNALLAYDRAGAGPSAWVFGADIGGGVNLSALPLVGHAFPAAQTLNLSFQPLIASQDVTQAEVAALRGLVPQGGFALPDRALTRGLSLATTLQVGSTSIDLSLPVGVAPSTGKLTDQSANPAQPSTPAPAGSTAAPDGVSWLALQRSFGPVQLQRVGVRYKGGELWFYLDAALSAAGLTLALDGLGAGISLADINAGTFHPKFSLRGVGIDYSNGTVEVGGSLLHLPPEATGGADEYDGMAVIRTPALSLSALGSYAELGGQRSLFLYAVLNYPIGGPAFFFVTGLAAGFGYNRSLRMPAIDQVASFPLVSQAVSGAVTPPPSGGAAQRTFLADQLTRLREYVPITPGEYFLAVGIHFTSFKQIDSFALLAVSFGQHVEVDLLGLSTALIPSGASTPLAEVQLALRATFLPAEGFLAVQAQLTNQSYIFSRDCHLTGGFAFYSWFAGEHAGDFVLTVGGYHPHYRAPAHYPAVPRLGFNWQITSELSVKGEAYFAMTAHALMAGGRLQATWESGSLKAWFDAGADFLVAWKPYHYEARVYVDIGVSYTFEFFGTHHITVDVGADLSLWGPPFSGVARIHLWIVSFSIEFGAGAGQPAALDWTTFRASFLPASDAAVCGVSATAGLVRTVPGSGTTELWIVNAKNLLLTTNAVIPSTRAALHDHAVTRLSFADDARTRPVPLTLDLLFDADAANRAALEIFLREHGVTFAATETDARLRDRARGVLAAALPRPTAIPSIGIAPMQVRTGTPASTHTVSVTYEGGDATEWFAFTPVLKKAPAALWGPEFRPDLNAASWVEGTLAGFEVRPRTPAKESVTHPIDRKNLQYDTTLAPTPVTVPAARRFVAGAAQGEAHLRAVIASDQTVAARDTMLTALGFDPALAVLDLDASVAGDFLYAPAAGTLAASP